MKIIIGIAIVLSIFCGISAEIVMKKISKHFKSDFGAVIFFMFFMLNLVALMIGIIVLVIPYLTQLTE